MKQVSRPILRIALLLLAMVGSLLSHGQDLNKLKDLKKPKQLLKGKGIKLSGMLSANNMFYNNATVVGNRTNPFTMLYTGNLTLDILGKIKMPINFSYSNQQAQTYNFNYSPVIDRSYQTFMPFNRLMLKPTYKGFSMQIGTCAMTFSPYTLAGHRYQGVGLQYKSPKIPYYFGFMFGNLQTTIDTTKANPNHLPATYKRTGIGLQVGYKKNQDKIEMIFFSAADKLNSLPYSLNYGQANAVLSLKGDKLIYKKFLWQNEIAISGMTQDVRAIEGTYTKTLWNSFGGSLNPNSSTDYRKALKTSLTYQGKKLLTSIEFSRIDPNYKTLGAYYFANDLQTLSGKVASQLLDGKLNVSGNVGIQQNNVGADVTLKTNKRIVGATNIVYNPTEQINLLFSYSTFSSYSNLRSVYDYLKQVNPYSVLDTTNYRQINQNMMLGANVKLPSSSKDITKTLSLNLTFQAGQDATGSTTTTNNLANYTLDYSYASKAKKLGLTGSLYYSNTNLANQPSIQWGPSAGLMKGVGENWKMNVHLTYTKGSTQGVKETMTNIRLGATGKIAKQVNVNFSANYLDRSSVATDRFIPPLQEVTLTLGLIYNFTLLKLSVK